MATDPSTIRRTWWGGLCHLRRVAVVTLLAACYAGDPTGLDRGLITARAALHVEYLDCESLSSQVRAVCEAIDDIDGSSSGTCATMRNYMISAWEEGRITITFDSDVYGSSTWTRGVSNDPAATIMISTYGDWLGELDKTLRHEYGHINSATDDEFVADSYMDMCISEI